MAVKIGINGFGRIGRSILRAALEQQNSDLQIVHLNDLMDVTTLAHLLRYDSVHGFFPNVTVKENSLRVGGRDISISAIPNPSELPWREKGVDIVLECTGLYKNREDFETHLKAGASKVLVSAPTKGEDLTVVYGVNSDKLKHGHTVVSNGSCTTNCLAPVTKVIHEHFTVESGLMNTIHSYTNDQRILDLPHKDLRRARAAAMNMIPTSTGAAKAIGLVIPELAGKIDGLAIRVPTPNVSIVDVTFRVSKKTTVEEVNAALEEASRRSLKGILGYTSEPLVSCDFNGNPLSSIVDGTLTKVIDGRLVKILSWYDNETGFSHRMLDVARLMAS
ncbi:MAG: type I glyceraldehyde-3-phosphate dehydrogenase [Deltaproteobacteria bacterium]|nr:type I glyceraldehyde-3-phosphate dehydrogenase [Deltaproteobacteria bacterium]